MGIYERINQLLKENDVTGKKLGELLGLKKSPLTDWKNGKSKPTVEQVLIICDIFAVSCDWLLKGKEYSTVEEKNTILPEFDSLYNMYTALPDEDKIDIYTYIKVRFSVLKEAQNLSTLNNLKITENKLA